MNKATTHYSTTETEGIHITVESRYLPEESDANRGISMFSYHVDIKNEGDKPARLVSRYWKIINADGEIEEVRGPGVVGKFPHLNPGESFSYTSYCPLVTSWGTMEGSYQMVREDGECFDAQIARFILADVQPVPS